MSASTDKQTEAKAVRQTQQIQSAGRMQQLLHGIRLAASDELPRADDLERLAHLIEERRRGTRRQRS